MSLESILTLNVHAFPSVFGYVTTLLPVMPERMRRIVAAIRATDTKTPDVICFQEVWSHDAHRIIVDGLGDRYPHATPFNKPNCLLMGSGLLIISRFPITDRYRETFGVYMGGETFAYKGFLSVRTGGSLVITTHMQADVSWLGRCLSNVRLTLGYISKAQIQQIVSYVKRCGSKSSPVIVAGDLNVIDTRWQYPEIVAPFGDVGLVRLELDEGTTTVVGESLLVVDHVFARGFDGYTVATGEFSRPTETSGRDKWFTDHNGVLMVAVGTGGR